MTYKDYEYYKSLIEDAARKINRASSALYNEDRINACKKLGVIYDEFPTEKFLSVNDMYNKLQFIYGFKRKFGENIIDEYLSKKKDIEEIKPDSIKTLKDIVDTCNLDYKYSIEERVSVGEFDEDRDFSRFKIEISDFPFPDDVQLDDYNYADVKFESTYDKTTDFFRDLNRDYTWIMSHNMNPGNEEYDESLALKYANVSKLTFIPEDNKEQFSFYMQIYDRHYLRILNESDYLAMKNKEYDKLSNPYLIQDIKKELNHHETLKEKYQSRRDTSFSIYNLCKELYKDNTNLINAITPGKIYDCLCEMAYHRISFNKIYDFMNDMNMMKDRLKKNAPSLRLLYEYKSNDSAYKANKLFSPNCPNIYAYDGDNKFNVIIKDYVAAEHERLTGHSVGETIANLKLKDINIDELREHSFEELNLPFWKEENATIYSEIGETDLAFAFLKQHPEMAKELAEVVQKRIDGLEEDIKNDEISGFDYRHQTLQNAEAIKNHANQIIERDSNNIEHDSSTKTSKPKTIDELIGIAKTMAENDEKDSQGNDDKKSGQKKDTDGPGGL